MKPSYKIEHWVLVYHQGITPDPEELYFRLEGFIKGRSPEIFEWEPAHTSKLLKFNIGESQAETLNSISLRNSTSFIGK